MKQTNDDFPIVLKSWIGSLSYGHALQIWEWLELRPISGPQAILAELEEKFQR